MILIFFDAIANGKCKKLKPYERFVRMRIGNERKYQKEKAFIQPNLA